MCHLFTTSMLRQIQVKSLQEPGKLRKMYDEARGYLENIGFRRTPLLSLTDADQTLRSFMFEQAGEKVLVEYKVDSFEETLKLVFCPLEIEFVYDILLMRFNQIRGENKQIFIYPT